MNIMVCGPSGVGKTSFIELFMKKFNYKKAIAQINSARKSKISRVLNLSENNQQFIDLAIKESTKLIKVHKITNDSANYELRLIDTVGYGNNTDLSSWRKNIETHLKGNVRTPVL